jgi:hypothetical protein
MLTPPSIDIGTKKHLKTETWKIELAILLFSSGQSCTGATKKEYLPEPYVKIDEGQLRSLGNIVHSMRPY